MEQWIHHTIQGLPLYALFIVIAVTLYTLKQRVRTGSLRKP